MVVRKKHFRASKKKKYREKKLNLVHLMKNTGLIIANCGFTKANFGLT